MAAAAAPGGGGGVCGQTFLADIGGGASSGSQARLLLADPNYVTAGRIIDAQRQILHDNNWIYKRALEEVLTTVALAAKQYPTHRSFEVMVPQGSEWIREYDHVHCIEYCIERLRARGFNVIVSPNVPGAIIVQWQRHHPSSSRRGHGRDRYY